MVYVNVCMKRADDAGNPDLFGIQGTPFCDAFHRNDNDSAGIMGGCRNFKGFEGHWTYFLGEFPIYSHRVDDQRMFRITIAQLIESGSCRQTEVINASRRRR